MYLLTAFRLGTWSVTVLALVEAEGATLLMVGMKEAPEHPAAAARRGLGTADGI